MAQGQGLPNLRAKNVVGPRIEHGTYALQERRSTTELYDRNAQGWWNRDKDNVFIFVHNPRHAFFGELPYGFFLTSLAASQPFIGASRMATFRPYRHMVREDKQQTSAVVTSVCGSDLGLSCTSSSYKGLVVVQCLCHGPGVFPCTSNRLYLQLPT